ncbi:DNA mismatch repair protein MutT [Thalassospira profundimaris]|uniref:DNA mismatch repair protein MutT n=1 Tax=Thalassospira profundimaris TaxID=502049 RepID=A0A367WPE5_9PROT|nr:NUDIX domain-containing protein [Thalassospira profundimaris]RCK43324.1 DNA mismatch repair protein MutT [Thalassospira profundimaris]
MSKTIKTVNWVLQKDGRTLSVRTHGRDRFYLPGGKIDAGETALAALKREIREELGVDLLSETITEIGVFSGHGHNLPDGTIVHMTCFQADYAGTLAPSREIAEMRWLGQEERHLMAPMGQKITSALLCDTARKTSCS